MLYVWNQVPDVSLCNNVYLYMLFRYIRILRIEMTMYYMYTVEYASQSVTYIGRDMLYEYIVFVVV